MYRRMLVLLDGSNLAEVVFSYARELSGRLGLDLDLLHICRPQETEEIPMREAYIQRAVEMLKNQSEETRSKAGLDSKNQALQVRGKIMVGYPAEEILKYAEENSIDIIMLATHGASGIRRWGLGGVADKVIHEAHVPVWLVPSQLHEKIIFDNLPNRFILVPLDGSKLAEDVIPHVKELVKQRGVETEVMLINVSKSPPVPAATSEANIQLIGENISALRTIDQVYLNGIVEQLQAEGIQAQAEQLIGNPAEEIVRWAAEHHPRLIVMSTHGRSGFSRFVFGSVAENVLRRLQRTPLFLISPGINSPLEPNPVS